MKEEFIERKIPERERRERLKALAWEVAMQVAKKFKEEPATFLDYLEKLFEKQGGMRSPVEMIISAVALYINEEYLEGEVENDDISKGERFEILKIYIRKVNDEIEEENREKERKKEGKGRENIRDLLYDSYLEVIKEVEKPVMDKPRRYKDISGKDRAAGEKDKWEGAEEY